MENEVNAKCTSINVEELHEESRQWKSEILFLKEELIFIKQLVNSYTFEPNTPNLFERLQEYKREINHLSNHVNTLEGAISDHENEMGGMLECTLDVCDALYYRQHVELQDKMQQNRKNYRTMKIKIFNYAGGILKQHKC